MSVTRFNLIRESGACLVYFGLVTYWRAAA